MFESRKFRVLVLAAVLIAVPILVVGVAMILGRATYDQFVEIAKWAIGSVGAVSSVFIAAVGYEDGKAKSVAPPPITNTGDNVTINSIRPPPPPPGAPAAEELNAPGANVTPIGGVSKSFRLPIAVALMLGALSIGASHDVRMPVATPLSMVGGCTGSTPLMTRVVDLAKVAGCVLDKYDPTRPLEEQLADIGIQCGIEEQSTIREIVSKHKDAMAREGAKLGAGVHDASDPRKKVAP